jgi:hypothetical protein
MSTQNSTLTRLVEYINSIFDNSHGHQRNAVDEIPFELAKSLPGSSTVKRGRVAFE